MVVPVDRGVVAAVHFFWSLALSLAGRVLGGHLLCLCGCDLRPEATGVQRGLNVGEAVQHLATEFVERDRAACRPHVGETLRINAEVLSHLSGGHQEFIGFTDGHGTSF